MSKSSEEIKKEITKEYNKDPLGWNLFAGRDAESHLELIVTHRDTFWYIKEEIINPKKTLGVGIRRRIDEEALKGLPTKKVFQFGFRPIDNSHINSLLMSKSQEQFNKILIKLLSMPPIPATKEVRTNLGILGPVYPRNSINTFMNSQKELDLKLRSELEKLLIKKHPEAILPYG